MSTISEKVLASHSIRESVKPGEIVKAEIDFAFMPALTAALAFYAMYEMNIKKVFDPDKVTILCDHIAPATNITNATLHKECRRIAKEQNLKYFYDINSGICHQIIPEHGHVYPGMLMVGADVTMVASVLLKNGIGQIREILEGVKDWLEEHDYDSISTMKGSMSSKSIAEPAAFERANYIKTLQSFK